MCGTCLGDSSDHTNEIVECDGCGVAVHEACYGIQVCFAFQQSMCLNDDKVMNILILDGVLLAAGILFTDSSLQHASISGVWEFVQ